MIKKSKLALCGLTVALSLLTMLLTMIIPIASYSLSAIAGVFIFPVIIEFGEKYAIMVYIAVSLLSMFLVPDKEAVFLFVAFLGYYPIAKFIIEKHLKYILQITIKLILVNLVFILSFIIAKAFFMIPDESLQILGLYLPWVFLILGNLLFIIFDLALTKLISFYLYKIRNRIIR